MMHSYFNSFANSYSAFSISGIGIGLFTIGALIFFVLALIAVALKGYALWHAAKRDDKGWFVALLLINTLGILELIYLYFVVGKWKNTDTNTSNTPPSTPSAQ